MKILKQIDSILEILDTKIKIKKKFTSKEWTAKGNVGDDVIKFTATKKSLNFYWLNFEINGYTRITGKGNQFKIFGVISQMLGDFIKQINPIGFSFLCEGLSRVKLYDRFAKIIEQKTNYILSERTSLSPSKIEFSFLRKDKINKQLRLL